MDTTEQIRKEMVTEINSEVAERKALEERYGQVWTTAEMTKEFEAIGFMAPFVVVRRRSDGQKGSLMFQHWPRFYFGWREDS